MVRPQGTLLRANAPKIMGWTHSLENPQLMGWTHPLTTTWTLSQHESNPTYWHIQHMGGPAPSLGQHKRISCRATPSIGQHCTRYTHNCNGGVYVGARHRQPAWVEHSPNPDGHYSYPSPLPLYPFLHTLLICPIPQLNIVWKPQIAWYKEKHRNASLKQNELTMNTQKTMNTTSNNTRTSKYYLLYIIKKHTEQRILLVK